MQTEAAMSLSDAWLGEGDAAAGEAQEEVHQALTSTDMHCKELQGQEDSGKSMECQLLWRAVACEEDCTSLDFV